MFVIFCQPDMIWFAVFLAIFCIFVLIVFVLLYLCFCVFCLLLFVILFAVSQLIVLYYYMLTYLSCVFVFFICCIFCEANITWLSMVWCLPAANITTRLFFSPFYILYLCTLCFCICCTVNKIQHGMV